jgi:hypothetical protein
MVLMCCSVTVNAAVPTPVDIERKTVGGTEYTVKIFTVSKDINAESLIEDDFEADGFTFKHTKTDRKENVSENSKTATKPATVDTQTNDTAAILQQFTPSMSYSEDGYFGTLSLDAGSIVTQPSGYGARNESISKTREYPGLMYNDPSGIPQSITVDGGVTVTLSNIEWVVTGTALAGDSLVPTEYKAVASYSGTRQVWYVKGYTTTVNYTGIVTKRTVDSVNYTITYTGTPLPTTATEPPPITEEITNPAEAGAEPTDSDESKPKPEINLSWVLPVLMIILTAAAVAGVIFFYKYFMKKKREPEISVYNLDGDEYVLLGVESPDDTNLTVELDKFGDSCKSNSFGFVLDSHSAEALNGKTLAVEYSGETLTHIIKKTDKSGEYRFKLIFGGDL